MQANIKNSNTKNLIKRLSFAFITILYFSCAAIHKNSYTQVRRKFIFTVTENVNYPSFSIVFNRRYPDGSIKEDETDNSSLYYIYKKKKNYTENQYRKFIRDILLNNKSIDNDIFKPGENEYKVPPEYKHIFEPKAANFRIVDSIINNNPNYVMEFFKRGKTFRGNYPLMKKEITIRLWDKNVGVRTAECGCMPSLLGYYNGQKMNDYLAHIKQEYLQDSTKKEWQKVLKIGLDSVSKLMKENPDYEVE